MPKEIASYIPEIIATRRAIHRRPELGWTEFETTALIAARLSSLGIGIRLGREIIAPEAALGRDEAEVQKGIERALRHGASPELIARMEGFTGCVGILETGGEEEDYIYLSLADAEALSGVSDVYDVVELSVSGSSEEHSQIAQRISASGSAQARLVKRVTRSEASVLGKLQALVFLVTLVTLVLTMISVTTTMTAVVSERRKEIGLRKALGASDNSIRTEFLG